MDKVIVSVEVVDIPTSWKSASEMRDQATNFHNEKIAELMDNLMAKIDVASACGALSADIVVAGSRPRNVYLRAQEILKSLGYTVVGDVGSGSFNRNWTIGW